MLATHAMYGHHHLFWLVMKFDAIFISFCALFVIGSTFSLLYMLIYIVQSMPVTMFVGCYAILSIAMQYRKMSTIRRDLDQVPLNCDQSRRRCRG